MKISRGFFWLVLCSGIGAAAQAQTFTKGAGLLAGGAAAGDAVLAPAPRAPAHTILPDAPAATVTKDDFEAADESSRSANAAGKPADTPGIWRPLTGRERLAFFWTDTYNSPGAFLTLSLSALGDQIQNKPTQWSADGGGYTRRFASAYGQLATRNVIHEGMAAASGLDPRYLPCQCKGIFRRSGHALKMSLVTVNRSGGLTLDAPQLAGAYGSGMISTYWYPHRLYNPLVQGVQFGHEEMGEIFVESVFHEFTPDLKSALHLR